MDKCFWKKVLAVIFGVSLISFITQGLTAVLNKITCKDIISNRSLEQVEELVNINFAVFGLLVILAIAIICVNLIKKNKLKISLEGVIFAVAIAIMIVGIVKGWDYRESKMHNEIYGDKYFPAVLYQKWQEYYSNLLSIIFFSFSTMTCVFVSSLLGCKKEEK